jgi:hypothetical protein
LAVRASTLSPFWGRFICLIDASQDRGPSDWIRAEGIEEIVPKLRFLGRTSVGQVRLWARCARGRKIAVPGGRLCSG